MSQQVRENKIKNKLQEISIKYVFSIPHLTNMFEPRDISEIKKYYKTNGYVMLKPLVSNDELLEIKKAIERTMGDHAIGKSTSTSFDVNDLILKIPHEITSLIFKEEYIKVLKELLNTEKLEIQHSKYNAKNIEGGSKVSLHQDYPFFPHTDERLVAFNFYLDGSNPQNGGMYCYPEFLEKPLDHIQLETMEMGVDPKLIKKFGSPLDFICSPGGSIHSCFLPHASKDSNGRKRRIMCFQLRHPENKQIGGALWKCGGINPETMSYNEPTYNLNGEVHNIRKPWEPKEYFNK